MDQTLRPLLIPPEFALYAEKNSIFELYQRLLRQLIMNRPDDSLQFLIEFLKKDVDSPAIIIIGPPASGKKSLSRLLAKKTGAVWLNQNNLVEKASFNFKNEFKKEINENNLKPIHWATLIKQRIEEFDCLRKGWILENFPQTRAQALALLSIGVIPKHSVILQGSDVMLIERAAGKRVDAKTGEIYHTTFDWPTDLNVQQRLVVPDQNTEEDLINRLIIYNRHIGGIVESLKATSKVINVDQPKGDVFNQSPYGSGRRKQAENLAKKYDIVNVPDSLLIPLLKERLSQLDCVSRGWVLHGFPRTRHQAESLQRCGFTPNRVFFIDIAKDSILERTTLRYLDPITGESYHLLTNPPPTQEIRDRLVQKVNDTEEVVNEKIVYYFANVKDLLEFYENDGMHINGDQDQITVFESIESGLVNPLGVNEKASDLI